jgi:hypothetical protein
LPRMDPRLVTIMVSCVILSTLLVVSIVRPAEEAPLLLLSNEFPEAIPKRPNSIGLESEISYVIMATRDFEEVEIRHTCLWEKDPGIDLPPNPEPASLPIVQRLEAEVEALGGEMEVIELRVELSGKEYTGKVADFSRFLEAFNEGDSLSALPLTFVILTHGDDTRYFEGSPCFFLEEEFTLDYLSLSRGENKTEYFQEGQMMGETLGISEAPAGGILTFRDVSRDERFSTILQVDIPEDALRQITEWTPEVHLLELVRCHGDGRLVLTIANPFTRGLSVEE